MTRDGHGQGHGLPDPADLDEDEAEYGERAGLTRPRRRKDASMTLLTSMLERPLDPGYAAAARQRVERGEPASTGARRPLLLVTVLLIGLLIGVSTATLRARDGARADAREQIIDQIHDRQAAVDEGGEEARRLQHEIDEASDRLDPALVDAREKDRTTLRVASGLVGVEGPGLRVTLDDARDAGRSADGDPRSGVDQEQRVQSRDLQIVTNGLWAAGAEAITVNDQRLTSHSAIRFAGEAILVNFRPLTRPYTIEAIGDPDEMRSSFAEGAAGDYLETLREDYDIRYSVETDDEMTMPGADEARSREASVIPPGTTPPKETPLEKESR